MSLYTAETKRLTKRRFTRLFLLGTTLILLAIAAGMFFTNEKVGPSQIASAQAQAQQDFQRATEQYQRDQAACQAPGANPASCEGMYQPTQDDFQAQWYMPPTFDFRENFPDMVTTLAALLALVAFIVGASFVGAEWSSGGMMNLLLWRPQRLQVLGTKLLALLVLFTVLTVVYSAIWTGIFVGIAEARGTTDSMTSGAWQSIALMELRGLALVLVAAAIGFGLASLGRHTAMALGVTIGAVIVFQFGLGTVLSLAKVKFAEAYLIPVWMIAWMDKEIKLEDYNSCNYSSAGGCQPDSLTLTWPMAGGLLAGIFVLIVGASMWAMRSRDIT
ncbi:ABC transporter permease subunit [Paractinoplanes lichenicola]|uniref:ABC transporter permease subunit n=1 Tax=Paractinoplanes lichenicola TaxID=2802976 RepID=A0ABS1VM36_9ACTN|nr:ABC transporter permease subunit [Actinoplanes lichenicola]MBL7254551.1 ABC transporter permease subunit [Actinoplanes lichenicola]